MQFVVDLTYPKELHDSHKDYPLALGHMKIDKVKKLVGTLCNKKEYSLHIRLLCLYIQLGLRVTRIYKVITFDHSSWKKTYIDMNIEKRKQAKIEENDFHSNLYKLKNNSVYGKTCENFRKRKIVSIVNTEKRSKSIISKPIYKNHVSITEKLFIFAEKQNEVFLNKPLYIKATILDFAKYYMYDFYYNVLKKHYKDRNTLCYTDTDSFILEIEADDIYQDFVNYFKEYIDFSEYDDMHPIFYGKR